MVVAALLVLVIINMKKTINTIDELFNHGTNVYFRNTSTDYYFSALSTSHEIERHSNNLPFYKYIHGMTWVMKT